MGRKVAIHSGVCEFSPQMIVKDSSSIAVFAAEVAYMKQFPSVQNCLQKNIMGWCEESMGKPLLYKPDDLS